MKRGMVYETKIGPIGIAETDGAVTDVYLNGTLPGDVALEETPLLEEASSQLFAYLKGERREFQLPLAPKGTDFQKKVWNALLAIPYGESRSYEEIAIQVGSPKACRAVGLANGRNPIALFIPCHRVIGKSGSLTGFGGGLPMKQALLALENGQF